MLSARVGAALVALSCRRAFGLADGIDLSKTGIMDDPEKRMRMANFVSGILERRVMQEVPRDAAHDLAVRVWVAVRNRESVTKAGFSS